MIRTIQNFELFYKKPFQMLNILTYRYRHFERGFRKWNNFMMLKYLIQTSIFCYSENDGSLTHETRIKDAVNMGDLICLLATVRTLKATNWVFKINQVCLLQLQRFINSFCLFACLFVCLFVTFFVEKTHNFVLFESYDFLQISPACGANNYFQGMFGETLGFQCQY